MDLIPINLKKGSDSETQHKSEIKRQLEALKIGLKELHETKLPNWRKTYEAIPAQRERDFPWTGASNLVIPIVAIHSDTLLARIMAAVFKTKPIWVARLISSYVNPNEPTPGAGLSGLTGQGGIPSGLQNTATNVDGEDLRNAIEEFLSYNAMEPSELDLYRVYEDCYGDVIKYGTVTIKTLWEEFIEQQVLASGDGSSILDKAIPNVVYSGPRPEKISFEDFWISPSETVIERAWFKAHRKRMLRHELEGFKLSKYYDDKAVNEIIDRPDRTTPYYTQMQAENDAGFRTASGYGYAEWDVFECWHYIRRGTSKYKVVSTYHLQTDTLLRSVYSPYPEDPFVGARLFLRDGFYYGYGFCELLGPFQEEISQIHNQRRDASTVANCNMLRVDPNSQLLSNYRIFPSATIPARKDEVETLQFGQPSQMSIDEERLSLDLAERRSGVSPPMQGSGAGGMTKKNVYSSMGTLSLQMEGNTRTDLNVSDLRYLHTKLGRVCSRQYSEFGLSDVFRFFKFGKKADLIKEALKLIKDGRILLPITSATASVNIEVEKQNDIILNGILTRHYGQITQMLMGAASPQLPPQVKEYVVNALKASTTAMRAVMKHFGYDEPERYVPDALKEGPIQNPQEQGAMNEPGNSAATNPNPEMASGTPEANQMAGGTGGGTVSGLANQPMASQFSIPSGIQ